MSLRPLLGEPLPWFRAPVVGGEAEGIETAAGQWVMLLVMGDASGPEAEAASLALEANYDLFAVGASFRGIVDTSHANLPAVAGGRWFIDADRRIAATCGFTGTGGWLLLDPMLRVADRAALTDGARLLSELRRRIAVPAPELPAPVLMVPDVLSPTLCRALIDDFERNGGRDSGFMREEGGLTVERVNYRHKRRADHHLSDPALLGLIRQRLALVLRPMILRAFQFEATRIERYLVACYDGDQGGHFRAHRDNTTRGTAHRRLACTINLDADAFEGGELCFPEFGRQLYRGDTGAAIVFSCSLLHEARPVTGGRRHAFLPFFYDNEAAALRERNQAFLAPELRGYRAMAIA